LDEDSKLESIIASLAFFYKGSASFEWLENQPISKLIRLQKEAEKINKQMQPKDK
jgi:hypothetical protein